MAETHTSELATKAELTKIFGVSASSINQYISSGMPVASQGRGGMQSKFNVADCEAWLQKNTNTQNEELADAKLRKAVADASLAELELERERGLVIPIEDVIALVGAEYTNIRAKLLGIPTQLCDELAVITDKKQVLHVLDTKIREILEELTADTTHSQPAAEQKKAKTKTKKAIDD